MASSQNKATHWQRTRNLTFVTLAIWFFFSFFVHWFGAELNTVSFMGFPCLLYTSPSPRDGLLSRMPSSA